MGGSYGTPSGRTAAERASRASLGVSLSGHAERTEASRRLRAPCDAVRRGWDALTGRAGVARRRHARSGRPGDRRPRHHGGADLARRRGARSCGCHLRSGLPGSGCDANRRGGDERHSNDDCAPRGASRRARSTGIACRRPLLRAPVRGSDRASLQGCGRAVPGSGGRLQHPLPDGTRPWGGGASGAGGDRQHRRRQAGREESTPTRFACSPDRTTASRSWAATIPSSTPSC